MSRRRVHVVLLCLFALAWCQVAAAAGICGSAMAAPVAATGDDAGHPGCHDDGSSESGDICCAPAAGSPSPAKSLTDDTPALATASWIPHRLAPAVAPTAPIEPDGLPPRNPPHFLGRLLI